VNKACPYCDCENALEGHEEEMDYPDTATIILPVKCNECGAAWNEIYEFSHRESKKGVSLEGVEGQ